MIYESVYWKNEIYKSFLVLSNFRHLKRITELSYVKVEKALMIGAYVIRKLDDANKIPPSILKNKLLINIYKNNDMLVDHLNCHKIDIIYNLEESIKEEKEWLFIINQIIHSFSFIYIFDNYNKFDGFLINSDKTKKRSIYYFPLKILLYMFLTVSEGEITSAYSMRDIIGLENNGKTPILGEMKLREAVYEYPEDFNIDKIIKETIKGNIYKRPQR